MSKVLIVEDAGDCLIPLKKLLQRDGHMVECAANGKEALTVAGRFIPDKVVTDLMMPEMDGVSFIKELRRDPRFAATPVVVFTALAHDRILKQLEDLNVAKVHVKSDLNISELLKSVQAC
jgi:CheY-like chemotaxis protein